MLISLKLVGLTIKFEFKKQKKAVKLGRHDTGPNDTQYNFYKFYKLLISVVILSVVASKSAI
jgi:hypothetical protein